MVAEKDLTSYVTISSVTASNAVPQLQTMNSWFQALMNSAQKISQQSIYSRYQELVVHKQQYKTGDEIKEQCINKLSGNMRDKFYQIVIKIIKELYQNMKVKQRESIYNDIQKNKPILTNSAMQTEMDSKTKSIQMLNKQKKILTAQIDNNKKQIFTLQNKITKLQKQSLQQKQQNKNLQKYIEDINQNTKKKIIQCQKLKIQFDKIQQINTQINNKNILLQNIISNNNNNLQEQQANQHQPILLQLDKIQDIPRERPSCVMARRRTILRDRVSLNFQAQNQLKIKKKQNHQLKKNMGILLSTLGQLNIINSNHQGNLDNYIAEGTFLQNVIQQLKQTKKSQNIEVIEEMEQKQLLQDRQPKQQKAKPTKHQLKSWYPTQKQNQVSKQKNKKVIKYLKKQNKTSNKMILIDNKDSQLQKLKSQFIQKLSYQKKIHPSRFKKIYLLSQTNDNSHDCQNNSTNFSVDMNHTQQIKYNKRQNYNHLISCKQIVFQQLKIKKKTKNPNLMINMKKHLNDITFIKKHNHHLQQKSTNSFLVIEGQQIGKYVKQGQQQFEHKKQKKELSSKETIKDTVELQRDDRGINFSKDVVCNQLNTINQVEKKEKTLRNNQNNLLVIKTIR